MSNRRSGNKRLALYDLVGRESRRLTSTLGEIVEAMQRDLSSCRRTDADAQAEVHRLYDEAYAHRRPDYLLWRTTYSKGPALQAPALAGGSPLSIAEEGIHHPNEIIVWGTLWMAVSLISGKHSTKADQEELHLAVECARRIEENLAPIDGGYAGCAVIALSTLSISEMLQFENFPAESWRRDLVVQHLDKVEKLVTTIDPTWYPGRRAVTYGLAIEKRRILTVPPLSVAARVGEALFRARGTVRSALDNLTSITWPDYWDIARRGTLLAYSAWRTARHVRIKLQGDPRISQRKVLHLYAKEMHALHRASQAARDAGFCIEAATLAHLVLRVIPDELLRLPEYAHYNFRSLGDDLATVIRQAGYVVDDRFARQATGICFLPTQDDEVLESDGGLSDAAGVPAAGTGVVPSDSGVICRDEPPENANIMTSYPEWVLPAPEDGPNPFGRRMARACLADPRWRAVLQHYPERLHDSPMDLLSDLVLRVRHRNQVFDEETLRSAFHLCLEYGSLNGASRLINRGRTTYRSVWREGSTWYGKREIIRFALAVTNAASAMPYGIDVERHSKWQHIIRKSWYRSTRDETFGAQERLVLHEALLGRCLSIFRNADQQAARTFAKKFYGLISDSEDREASATEAGPLRRGPVPLSVNRLLECLRSRARGPLGPPVFVSAVCMNQGRPEFKKERDAQWSLLAIGASGELFARSVTLQGRNIYREAEKILRSRPTVHGPPLSQAKGVFRLVDEIVDLARRADAGARWLVLAIEPKLAALPWQRLVLGAPGAEGLVVSLIPSFTWAAEAHRERRIHPSGLKLVLSREDLLVEPLTQPASIDAAKNLRNRLLHYDKAVLQENFHSSVIVLGHGQWSSDDGLTTVVAPDRPIRLTDPGGEGWLDLAERRVVIVHACFGGRVGHDFLGDLRGLPGVALGGSCRLFCAPIAQVHPAVAGKLHEALARRDGPDSFGERYLEAVSEQQHVALYNLYGFADEPVGTPRPPA